jgi:hypothetical protein
VPDISGLMNNPKAFLGLALGLAGAGGFIAGWVAAELMRKWRFGLWHSRKKGGSPNPRDRDWHAARAWKYRPSHLAMTAQLLTLLLILAVLAVATLRGGIVVPGWGGWGGE